MKKIFTLLLLFLVVDLSASSLVQPVADMSRIVGAVSLNVVEDDKTEPAMFAAVALYNGDTLVKGTETDELGHFLFEGLKGSRYTIKLHYVGYKSDSVEVDLLSGEGYVELVMEVEQNLIEEIVIMAYKVPLSRICGWTCGSTVTCEFKETPMDSTILMPRSFAVEHQLYKVFPNPANSVLQVDMSTDYDQLRLYSVHGARTHLDKELYSGLNRFGISTLVSGQYVLLFYKQGALMDTELIQVVQD